jgi:hypothetical protein
MEPFLKFSGFIIIYIALFRAMDTTDGIMSWIFGLGYVFSQSGNEYFWTKIN